MFDCTRSAKHFAVSRKEFHWYSKCWTLSDMKEFHAYLCGNNTLVPKIPLTLSLSANILI